MIKKNIKIPAFIIAISVASLMSCGNPHLNSSYEDTISSLMNEIQSLKNDDSTEMETLKNKIESLNEELILIKNRLEELETLSETQSVEIEEQQNEIEKMQEELGELKEKIDKLNSAINNQGEELSLQKQKIDELKEQLNSLQRDIENLQSIIEKQLEIIEEQNTKLGNVNRSYNQKGGFFECDYKFFETPEETWYQFSDPRHNNIEFNNVGEDFTFEVISTFGSFKLSENGYMKDNDSLDFRNAIPGQALHWNRYSENGTWNQYAERSYVKIYVKNGERFVGYGVIEINARESLNKYTTIPYALRPTILASKLIEGEVTKSRIDKAIDSIISNRPLGLLYSFKESQLSSNETTGWKEIDFSFLNTDKIDADVTDEILAKDLNYKRMFCKIDTLDVSYCWYSNYGYLNPIGPNSGNKDAVTYNDFPVYWCDGIGHVDSENDYSLVDYLTLIPKSFNIPLGYSLIKITQTSDDSIAYDVLSSKLIPALNGTKQSIEVSDITNEVNRLIDVDEAK